LKIYLKEKTQKTKMQLEEYIFDMYNNPKKIKIKNM
jgi:hypothetical protein